MGGVQVVAEAVASDIYTTKSAHVGRRALYLVVVPRTRLLHVNPDNPNIGSANAKTA
jgi:hypothetical protein